MDELKKILNQKVTEQNLCSKEIVKLSQDLDEFVVQAQRKLMK